MLVSQVDDGLYFIEDFHIRLVALHSLCAVYWHLGIAVPGNLMSMAAQIPCKYLGRCTTKAEIQNNHTKHSKGGFLRKLRLKVKILHHLLNDSTA